MTSGGASPANRRWMVLRSGAAATNSDRPADTGGRAGPVPGGVAAGLVRAGRHGLVGRWERQAGLGVAREARRKAGQGRQRRPG